jgi:hypothetical protein
LRHSPLRRLRLLRIVEEELVAVEILDHEQPVAPVAVLDGSAAGFELVERAATAASCVSGSTVRETNIRPLPAFS